MMHPEITRFLLAEHHADLHREAAHQRLLGSVRRDRAAREASRPRRRRVVRPPAREPAARRRARTA